MSPRVLFLAGTGGLAFMVVFALTLRSTSQGIGERRESELGRTEDPESRMMQEWLKLRDPVTGKIPEDIRNRELRFAAGLPDVAVLQGLGKRQSSSAAVWMSRGPFNIGGRTRACAVDATDPSVLLAGAVSGGMWRSTDRGVTWHLATGSLQLHSVTCVVQDRRPGHTLTWYYGTGELIGNSAWGGAPNSLYRGNGIFKSTDGGASWNLLPSTSSNTPGVYDNVFDYVFDLAVDSSNAFEDELYAATISAVNRSTDGGITWNAVRGGYSSSESRYTDVAVTPTGVVYATMSDLTVGLHSGATSRGLWRSTDGLSWANIVPSGWPSQFNRVVIGISPTDPDNVYFLGETPGAGFQTTYAGEPEGHSLWKYRYVSGDGSGPGGEWTNLSSSLPAFGPPVGSFASQGSYDLAIRVKPDDPSCIFIGGTNLYRSRNAGATWEWVGGYSSANDVSPTANHHPDQHGLVFSPDNFRVLYSVHDGGISVTDDCLASTISWRSLNHGYQTSQFYTVAIDHGTAGSPVILGGTQDNGSPMTLSADAAVNWDDFMGGDGGYCSVSKGAAFHITSYQMGEIYRFRSSDGKYVRIDPVGGSGYLFIAPFAVDPNVETILYLAAGSRVWRNSSLDAIPFDMTQNPHAQGWTSLDATSLGTAYVSALGVSSSPPNRLYFGSSDGRLYRLDDAHQATSTTVPKEIWTAKGFPPGGYVSCIAVDPHNADHLFVTFSNYNVASVFASEDGGSTWTDVEGNLAGADGPSVRWAAIVPLSGTTTYFVATSTGIYSAGTLNGGGTVWAQEGAGAIGNVVVDMLDYRILDGKVVAATHGQGVFSANLPGGSAPPPVASSGILLGQNYPNPFNGSTVIPFRIGQTDRAIVQIYTITGQLVGTLLDRQVPDGEASVVWTPQGLSSGVYVCRLISGAFSETRALIYMK